MLGLRQYKKCDAEKIVSWVKDETEFRKWSSDRFGDYPVSADTMNEIYFRNNGGCSECDNFYPFTAFDENGAVGHIIIRCTDAEKKTVRFGFVIVDDKRRGTGCGKKMLSLAAKYAFEIYGAEKITIGVFENNPSAYHCYKNIGFSETGETEYFEFFGEKWKIIEMEMTRKNFRG